jgi:hypothetical protein
MNTKHLCALLQDRRGWILLAFVLVMFAGIGSAAFASSGGDYILDWYTIDAGGGTSTGGDYSLSGTIGQPDAGQMGGGEYAVSGGFWGQFVEALYELFLPLIQR